MEYETAYARTMEEKGETFRIAYFDEIDSTSDYLKRQVAADNMPPLPFVAVADRQTAGRGRIGNRAFFSPRGGLYVSAAFAPETFACGVENATLAAGVATARAIESLSDCRVGLKWVNDVLLNGKKAAGILCESVVSPATARRVYIVGIGVNLSSAALGDFMPEKAGALPQSVDRDELLFAVLRQLYAVFTDDTAAFTEEYNARLVLRGKRLRLRYGEGSEECVVLGASSEGLLCRTDAGKLRVVRANDEILTDLYALL